MNFYSILTEILTLIEIYVLIKYAFSYQLNKLMLVFANFKFH